MSGPTPAAWVLTWPDGHECLFAGPTPPPGEVYEDLPRRPLFEAAPGYELILEHVPYRDALRQAVADYMHSEGCGCCRDGEAHERHAARLGELLGVDAYADGSGHDFSKHRTPGK